MTISDWKKKYANGIPITLLAAHDATFAQIIEDVGIDGILVGDSLRHTFFGDSTTVTMTLDHMIYHTQAVKNGAKNTLIIADMPFMTYNISVEETLRNAAKLIQAGAQAVKCEVRDIHLPTIDRLVQEGIPVMGHIGLQPQYIHETGGYVLKGTSDVEQKELMHLAKSLSDIGAFSVVLEKVPIGVTKQITEAIPMPTIGIGAGPYCSGQVLVTNDALGFTPNFSPKFLKKYLNGRQLMVEALKEYKTEVETGQFPTESHGYTGK